VSGAAGVSLVYNSAATITTSGGSALMLPKTFQNGNPWSIRGCLFSHYDGGSSLGVQDAPFVYIGHQRPVLGLDYNQTNVSPWGDPQQMTDMLAGYNYLAAAPYNAAPSGTINLLGVSMGGLNSLVYAAHNPSKVQSLLICSPALSLYTGMYTPQVNLGWQVNTAYSVANAAALLTTSDPTWGTSGGFGTKIATNRDPYYMSQNGYTSAFTGTPITILQGGVKLTGLSITATTTTGSGTAIDPWINKATITGAGITTSNVSVGMWLTWATQDTTILCQVLTVAAGTATVAVYTSNYKCTATGSTTLTGTGFSASGLAGYLLKYNGSYGEIASSTTTVLTVASWTPSQPTAIGLYGPTPMISNGTITAQSNATFYFSNDYLTWPAWADGFTTAVNGAGGNVSLVWDNFGGHAIYTEAAMQQAIGQWLPYA